MSLNNFFCFLVILKDFHEEYAKVAFKKHDPKGSGFISALDFNDILINIKCHLLTPDVKANLIAVNIPKFVEEENGFMCSDVGGPRWIRCEL